MRQNGRLRLRDVRRRFDRAAGQFDGADFVHRSAFDGLLERLTPVAIRPERILDLGSASGTGSRQLAKTFRGSRVISLDASAEMLRTARRKKSILSKSSALQAAACQIPLRTGSTDLVFANLLLPWIDDLAGCFREISRVLRKGGVFAFSTFGPDSLAEIREAWSAVDNDLHVNAFPDMHDIGDTILRSGLADPVLDVDFLTVTYRDVRSLYRDLTACGARNSLRGRRRTLTGRERFDRMQEQLAGRMKEGVLSLRLELVYGHAWGTGSANEPGEYRFDPGEISRRKRP